MKFPVYESIYFLNRNIDDLLVILEEIKKCPGIPEKSFEAYKVDIQYLRSQATQDVLEVMNNAEIRELAKLGKQRRRTKTVFAISTMSISRCSVARSSAASRVCPRSLVFCR